MRTYPRLPVIDVLSTFDGAENDKFSAIVCDTATFAHNEDGPMRERIYNDPDGMSGIDERAFTGMASAALRDNQPSSATLHIEPEEPCFGDGGGCTCHPAVDDTPIFNDLMDRDEDE